MVARGPARSSSGGPRRFYVRTFGCQMNEHDSLAIAAGLVADGLEQTDRLDLADVVVLNTCCVRENADNKLYGHLGHLKPLVDAKPGLQIAVGGCLAQRERDALVERAPHVSVVFGTHDVKRAATLLREARASGKPVVSVSEHGSSDADPDGELPSALPVGRGLAHSAWVTIQAGCDNSCAFCTVPAVRGPEKSRPFAELVAEVAELARAGTTEVTLLGQNVNSYGRDLTVALRRIGGTGFAGAPSSLDEGRCEHLAGAAWAGGPRRPRPLFADLLRAIGAIEGIRRIRFTSPHPKDLRSETIAAMAETPSVCEQLHLPLQSGSDAVLAAMRRGYNAERYLERLGAARAMIRDLAVTTDLIVGFPGESEDDFVRTLEVVAEARFDSAYTFVFSPRPGTLAGEMHERFVPDEVVAERFERLKAVVERSALTRNESRIGRIEEIAVEGPSKRDPAMWTGRTRQGKIVHFSPQPGARSDAARAQPASARPASAQPVSAQPAGGRLGSRARPGSYVAALVTAAAPHHLVGELVQPVRSGLDASSP